MSTSTRSTSSSSSTVLVASVVTATAAAAAFLVYTLTRRPTVSSKTSEAKEETKSSATTSSTQNDNSATSSSKSDGAPVQKISKETLVKVFAQITTKMQHVIMRLAAEEQKIIRSNQTAGAGTPQLTGEQIQRFLLQRFQEGVAEVEVEVYKQNEVTEDQVKSAAEEFAEEPEVKKAIAQLKTVYNAVMGPSQADLPDVPSFMTREKTLEILKLTMDILREKAEAVAESLKSKGIERQKDPEKFQKEFQVKYAQEVEAARKTLYEKEGIQDELVVQAAVVKYQGDLTFQQILKSVSETHNAKMAQLGFFPAAGGM